MARQLPRCPRCRKGFPWGTTVCPGCHIGLEVFASGGLLQETAVFETADRPSADIVAGLLTAHGVPCTIRGTDNLSHMGMGRTGLWRVFVASAEEPAAQEILDAEIGREEEGEDGGG